MIFLKAPLSRLLLFPLKYSLFQAVRCNDLVDKYIEITRGVVLCGYNIDNPGLVLAGG